MATTLYDLCVNITANDSEAVKGINNVGSSTEGLSAKTVAMGKIMADAFEAVIKKVAEYGQKIVQVGMDQETALAKVNTIMDTSVLSTEEMAKAITDLSNETGESVANLSDTVYNAISATGDTAHAVDLASQASKLATAGFTDTSSALSTLTTAMNAYHLSAEEVEHISDSLITVQNLGVTTVGELSSSMGKAIASASAYGVNLENLESAYISITKAGINTAEGTTYISSMMKELGDSGSNVSGVLQEVAGKSFDQLMKEGASLGDVLEILNASVDGDATALMNLWSSAEAGKASSAIIGQGITEFNNNLKQLQTTTGTTETAFETMANTLEHKVSIFKTTGENLMASLYNGMSGNLGDIVGFGTELIQQLSASFEAGGIEMLSFSLGEAVSQAIGKLSEYLPSMVSVATQLVSGFVSGLSEAGKQIGTSAMNIIKTLVSGLRSNAGEIIQSAFYLIQQLAETIGESAPEIGKEAVLLLSELLQGIFDNMDMIIEGAIALVEGLSQGVMEALPVWYEQFPSIMQSIVEAIKTGLPMLIQCSIDMMNMLVANLPTIIQAFIDALPIVISSIVDALITCAPQLVQGWITLTTTMLGSLPEIIVMLVSCIPEVISAIIEGFAPLTDAGTDIATSFTDAIRSLFVEKIPEFVDSIITGLQKIVDWFTELPETMAFLLGRAIANFRSFITTLITETPKILNNVVNAMIRYFKTLPSNIKAQFDKVVSSLHTMITSMSNKISSAVPTMVSNFVGFFSELPSKLQSIGEYAIEGFVKGITNAWKKAKDTINEKVNDIKESFEEGLDINSPSRYFKWIGEMCVAGFDQGFSELADGTAFNGFEDSLNTFGTKSINIGSSNGSSSTAGSFENNITITLEGDAKQLFKIMQKESKIYSKTTGQHAFA